MSVTGDEKKIYVTEDQKNRANEVDLVDYLLSIGEPIKGKGNYYRHQKHDSLVINAGRNYFSWNSKGVSGNAVTYLMSVHNMNFQEAVLKINNDVGQDRVKTFNKEKRGVYLDEFTYDVKEVKYTAAIMDYLVNDRKINKQLVKELIDADYIKQDNYKNVVFKWKNNGSLIGANLQGTREIPIEKRFHPDRKYFKKVLPNTEENTFEGFNIRIGYPKNLYFFESSIDLLSYFSLHRDQLSNCLLKSMDGLVYKSVIKTIDNTSIELWENKMDIEKISICVDNDKAGLEFYEKISLLSYIRKDESKIKIVSDIPSKPDSIEKWDWNNELKSQKSVLKQEQIIKL